MPCSPLSARCATHTRIAVLVAAAWVAVSSQASDLPPQAAKLWPKGHSVLAFAAGDFNGDGLTDFAVVLRSDIEAELVQQGDAPDRPLLILHGSDQGLRVVARNDHVVMAADQGGQCDPFVGGGQGIAVKGHFLTIENAVACGDHWTDYVTFRFDENLKDYVFHKRVFESLVWDTRSKASSSALVPGAREVTTADRRHPVKLADY